MQGTARVSKVSLCHI